VPISSWSTALAAVDQNSARVDLQHQCPDNQKYIFPEPGIFIAANEMCHAWYFMMRQAIESVCMYHIMSSSSATPFSNQEWHDILIGDITSKTPTTKSALAQEHACCLLGSAMNDLDINISNMSPAELPVSLSDAEAQWML
jgi:hypothetical protein